MSQELQDELTSINSIYGEHTLNSITSEDSVYTLTFPSQPDISFRVDFPEQYPDVPPSILGTQSVGGSVGKGDGAYLVDLVRDVLADVYTPGAPCIFDLVEEVDSRLQDLGLDKQAEKTEEATSDAAQQQYTEPHSSYGDDESTTGNTSTSNISKHHVPEEPPWTLSTPISEKKSLFIARCAPVTSTAQARSYLARLLETDKKAAKATHNITAWRIQGDNGVQFQDCDDDGETAAGGRLLHLLELMKAWDVMVVVSRWYGGVHLGPDRFRIINAVARDALVLGGFGEKDIGKGKKGRK
ncbi:ribosomal protein S5 domain 2-type protein [Neohortaea acidophila]|uniref:Ribosomal protein S5 domain 2-type protein n=1 Tax=Neohortaea acidophila TaxID=245834 RepID=A0A6A6PVU4_9PEZI|nr:ribosomal protein S5 domain 2-type protein [Neohortaea acidophila]KAF2483603.1 ribosomal protein S5 domain 2-type protein [Neohortaea acidophila]